MVYRTEVTSSRPAHLKLRPNVGPAKSEIKENSPFRAPLDNKLDFMITVGASWTACMCPILTLCKQVIPKAIVDLYNYLTTLRLARNTGPMRELIFRLILARLETSALVSQSVENPVYFHKELPGADCYKAHVKRSVGSLTHFISKPLTLTITPITLKAISHHVVHPLNYPPAHCLCFLSSRR